MILSSQGQVEEEAIHIALHRAVVGRLKQDHQRVEEILKKDLEIRMEQRARHLAELKDQARVLQVQIERLDDERKLLVKEIGSLTKLIAAANQGHDKLIEEASGDEPRALTQLMLMNQIGHNRTRLIELEKRVNIGLVKERYDLLNALANNLRAQSEQQAQIEALRLQLANMRERQAIVAPMRSLDPVGIGRKIIVVLAGLIGLFLGIMAAFAVEFTAKVRQENAPRRAA